MNTQTKTYRPFASLPTQELEVKYSDLYHNWIINLGANHGIIARARKSSILLAIFEQGDLPINPQHTAHLAAIIKVRSSWSEIDIQGYTTPDKTKTYKAKILTWPINCIRIYFDIQTPESENVELVLLSDALKDEIIDQYKHTTSFATVQVEENKELADYWINLYEESGIIYYRIIYQKTVNIVHQEVFTQRKAVTRLNKIAQWTNVYQLNNPFTQFDKKDIQLIVEDIHGQELAREGTVNFRLDIDEETGDWIHPFNLKLVNNSPQDVYCSLLYLSDKYEVNNELLPNLMLAAGTTTNFWDFGDLETAILQEEAQRGRTVSLDTFKLLISDQPFESRVLNQLDITESTSLHYRSLPNSLNTFQHLLNTIKQGYVLTYDHEAITAFSNWFTQQITIKSQIK